MADRLRDDAVAERLARLDELLAQLEQAPGPAGEVALEAVSELTQVYGEALARAIAYTADVPGVREKFIRDELLGHLLVLHDIHPEPVDERVRRVVEKLKRDVAELGGTLRLSGIDSGVATLTLSIGGCGSSGVADAVREAVLAVAPELSDVVLAKDPAFVPLESLTLGRSGP
jgi:AcrR family transcriptional regulator